MDGEPAYQVGGGAQPPFAQGQSIEAGGDLLLGNVQTAPGTPGGDVTHFQGAMSDIGIFNRVFSQTDIQVRQSGFFFWRGIPRMRAVGDSFVSRPSAS
eukprot:3439297-Rhodomonas_salina.1